jgi:hypothetical protein
VESLRPSSEILDYIKDVIRHIYQYPTMHGQTAESIEAVLHAHHHLCAWILDRVAEYSSAKEQVRGEESAGNLLFAANFVRSQPESTELERAKHVASCYRKIDELMGLQL